MIPVAEVHRRAREAGVPETTIIRDYAQNHLLCALFEEKNALVLKGGTCLRKIYFPNYRFSDDLDFTLNSRVTQERLTGLITGALSQARRVSGILFEASADPERTNTGMDYEAFYVYGPLNLRMKIKLDITKATSETVLLPVEYKDLIHPYPDSLKAVIPVYSLEEIFAEKARSLFQRVRPRDLFDVWYLQEQGVVSTDILEKKCAQKGIELNAKALIKNRPVFKTAWENSLRHQMKAVPDFEQVFDSVLKKLASPQ